MGTVVKPPVLDSMSGVVFRRTEESMWESGILLNRGEMRILDFRGKIVENVYDYDDSGIYYFNLDLTGIKRGLDTMSRSKNSDV